MSPRRRVRLAVTMGDPAGIGPEVTLKAITARASAPLIEPILVGDPAVWRETAQRLRLHVGFADIGAPARPGYAALVVTSQLPERYRAPGAPRGVRARAACGAAAHAAILAAVRLVKEGQARGMVTAPINKSHMAAAGYDFPGHTELLAELCGGVPVRMMMAGPRLRVVLVTIHLPLAEVPCALRQDSVFETITLTDAALRQWFGISAPRIAVTGLNPHAGENGRFGDEEARIIAPAVRAARRRRIAVDGPLAADGVFGLVATGRYDAIVCMYHDQGLAPFKLLHFADGVNVTLGLPFVRTSPDHGTAFDIAGSGKADARSMIAALQLAARLARGTKPLVASRLLRDGR